MQTFNTIATKIAERSEVKSERLSGLVKTEFLSRKSDLNHELTQMQRSKGYNEGNSNDGGASNTVAL